MKLTKNFNLEEFTKSVTAKNKGIDNTIPEKYMCNVKAIAEQLQIVRDAYNKPIVVTSGYRCPALNKAVGGVKTSQHQTASAADIHSLSDTYSDNKDLWNCIIELKNKGKLNLRQIINEYEYDWIHLAVNDSEHSIKHNEEVWVH